MIGTVLNERWRIDGKLADGGMSSLWVASPVAGGAKVAVKVLNRELDAEPSIRQRFLREAQLVNSIDHPGVVPIVDSGLNPTGQPFMVMELLEGATAQELADRRGGRLPYDEVVRIGEQVLAVLAVAHAKGVVHRDIKPENLFVEKSGRVRVLDFGLGKALQLYSDAASTAVGTILGTPEFMAPERAMGKTDLDARADIWATGATLFKLASGASVHEGETAIDVLMAAATKPARSLAVVARDAPPGLVAAVDRALAFELGARWVNATEMRGALLVGAPGWTDTTAAIPESPHNVPRQDKTLMMSRPEDVAAMRAAIGARSDSKPPLSQGRPQAGPPPSMPRPPMGSVPDSQRGPRPPMESLPDSRPVGYAPTSDPRPPYGSWSGGNPPASQPTWQAQQVAPAPVPAETPRGRGRVIAAFVAVVVLAVATGLILTRVL